jgi:hypothetical protein
MDMYVSGTICGCQAFQKNICGYQASQKIKCGYVCMAFLHYPSEFSEFFKRSNVGSVAIMHFKRSKVDMYASGKLKETHTGCISMQWSFVLSPKELRIFFGGFILIIGKWSPNKRKILSAVLQLIR